MRALLRRLPTRGRHRTRPPSTHGTPAPRGCPPLSPARIRDRRFSVRRRGLDPTEIAAFLDRVADELAVAQIALAAVREESVRIRDALRTWQSTHAPSPRELARW